MRIRALIVVSLALAPAFASDPGQPLDCSDLVPGTSGLTCTSAPPPNASDVFSGNGFVDNDGRLIYWKGTAIAGCGNGSIGRKSLVAFDNGVESVLAYFQDRCVDPEIALIDTIVGPIKMLFDPTAGEVRASIASVCKCNQCQLECPGYPDGGISVSWIARLGGFTTLFDVLQTFEPSNGTLSFRVPHMPEGLAAADRFDTYYGDLATVGDWSRARSMQCAYPAAVPEAGDYVVVPDLVPDPAPGEGIYYVTSVSHQGQTRYGRRASGGALSGRDSAVLPACD